MRMRRTFLRTNMTKRTWCHMDINLNDGQLTVSGSAGYILTPRQAKKESLNFWEDYYETELTDFQRKDHNSKSNIRSAKGFAKAMWQSDYNEYPGLDVFPHSPNGKVLVKSALGPIRNELKVWYPCVVPLFPWHLNYMFAGCEHQHKRLRDSNVTLRLGDACPECVHIYGNDWTKIELPERIVELAQTVYPNYEVKL